MSLIGQKQGRLIVLRIHGKDMHSHNKLLFCQCECGREKIVRQDHFLRGETKSCGCFNSLKNHGKWKGVGEIGKGILYHYKASASKRKIPFRISLKYMWNLYLKQNRLCALTGEHLYFGTKGSQYSPTGSNASLDRIDNTRGYVKGNLQWVTKDVNLCRRTLSITSFISLCEKVTKTNKNYDKKIKKASHL